MKLPGKPFFISCVMLACYGFTFLSAPTWKNINNSIDNDYPQEKNLSTDELNRLTNTTQAFLLLDVRDEEEFQVSHLPGAIHITEPGELSLPLDTQIIVYCSVGLRSAHFVQQLMKRGYTNVYNLRGSIFEWANKGYPLVAHQRPSQYVHPYNEKWGILLQKRFHRYKVVENIQ